MKLREQKIKENSSKKETLDYMEENNDTKLLDEFKDDVLTLSYKDKDHLDRIRRKGKMLIQNIHGKESEYLGDFDKISFYARVAPVEESYKRECWEGGKNAIINLINTMLEELAIFGTKKNILTENNKLNNNNRIFIVHGRDSAAKIEVARFIEKLGFEAIILHEQASSGKTIIEKIEEYSNVGFAIVLYTPCDVGSLSGEETKKFRARQNVVFEHGYLIGKLSRKNVCALVKGDIETPTDINGVVYIPLDDNGAWHIAVSKELRSVGYSIDLNKILD